MAFSDRSVRALLEDKCWFLRTKASISMMRAIAAFSSIPYKNMSISLVLAVLLVRVD